MDRTPPVAVRRALRKEVGFGCPLPGCCNPYLEYHHFDPAWHVEKHHNVEGMIALCAEHHNKADAGAFTNDQLRAFKRSTGSDVSGRFDWLRQNLLTVVGGNLYYETPMPVQFQGKPQIWYTRDINGYMLLNVRMVSGSQEPRLRLDENDWIVRGEPIEFESPPSGRKIHAKYANGDTLSVEFFELQDGREASLRYPDASDDIWKDIQFPITAVEIQSLIGGTDYGFGPKWSKLGGFTMRGFYSAGSPVGLAWG